MQTCAKPGKVSCAYLRFASALGFLEAARRLILTVWSDPVEFCVGNLPLSLLVKGQGGRIFGKIGLRFLGFDLNCSGVCQLSEAG